MRGFAVIFMVMGHSIDSVLSVTVRSSQGFILYDAIRGFTAPIFLFVSGYAYIVATERKWNEFRTFGPATRKRLAKIVLLFVIGYALHSPYFSLNKILTHSGPHEYAQFFQVDVLHCVAAALLILQLLLFVSPSRNIFAGSVLAIGIAMVFVTPFIWRIDFAPLVSPFFSPYFNWKQTSIFPLFPFAAFLFAGVVAGHFYLEARERDCESEFVKNLLVLAVVVVAAGINFDWLGWTLFPHHDYWKASPNWFLVRAGIVAFVCSGFYYVRNLPQAVEKNLIMLGQASLIIYPIHLLIVYGSSINFGLMQRVGQTLAAHQAIFTGVGVLLLMLIVTYVWNYLSRNFYLSARLVQAGLASSLLYTFLTRPW